MNPPDRDDYMYWLMRLALALERDDSPDSRAEVEHIERMLGADARDFVMAFCCVRRLPGESTLDYLERAPPQYDAEVEAEVRSDYEREHRPGESFDAWLERDLLEFESMTVPR